MDTVPARVGGLLVVSGSVLAFALGATWAIVVGAALLVIGGLVLAVGAESMLELDVSEEASRTAETPEPIESEGGLAA
jgi:dipeptide/tripeptide permease